MRRKLRAIHLLLPALIAGWGPAQAASFIRGDADQNQLIEITDGITVLGYLFLGSGAPSCLDALDVDDNGRLEITDGIGVLGYLFLGAAAPPAPFPDCGPDPTADPDGDLGCASHAACPQDDAGPAVSITLPGNLSVVGVRGLAVEGRVSDASDPIASLVVRVNGEAATVDAGTGTFTAFVPLLEGTNLVTAVAVDAAGNAGSASISVFLDTQRPVVVVETPAARGAAPECSAELSDVTTEAGRVTITGYLNDIGSTQVGGAVGSVTVRSTTCAGEPIVAETLASFTGKAFVVVDFPLRRGVNRIEVAGRDGVGNESRPVVRTVTYTDLAGQRIEKIAGDEQAGVVNGLLLDPLVVSLLDADGRAVPGRTVKFEVVRNSGRLSESLGAGNKLRELFVRTDGSGRAEAFLTLGDRVGAGYNRVRATAAGFQGEAFFCATAVADLPSKVLATEGASQTGIPGQALPRPLVAMAVDGEGNPIPALPITFEVREGGGSVARGGEGAGGGGAGSLIVETNDEGLAACVFTLGEQEGLNAHVAVARFEGLSGLEAVYTASAKAPRAVEETAVVGVVLDNTDVPLAGVTALLLNTGGMQAITDAEGIFRIEGAPVGTVRLRIDGSTTTRPGTWPALEFQISTIAGQDNDTGGPIRLPPVDEGHSFLVGGDQTVVVTMEGVPGMSLTVFPRSATFSNGDTVGRISLSQVKLDKVPMPPPNGSIFMPPAWTIQPPGVFFDPPARVSIPNDGLPPGRIIDIFQFDHDLELFTNVGTGTVVSDASVIISDPGFGVTKSGWGGCGNPPPPPTCAASCDDGNPCTTDACVNGSCVSTPITTPKTAANGCEGCNNGTRLPPKTNAECCADNSVSGSPVSTASTHGWVVCCNGQKTVCVKPLPPASYALSTVLDACARKHEEQHFGDIDCPTGANECDTSRPSFKNTRPQADGECDAYKVTIDCLRNHDCMGNATCQTTIDNYIASYKNIANGFKAGCVP